MPINLVKENSYDDFRWRHSFTQNLRVAALCTVAFIILWAHLGFESAIYLSVSIALMFEASRIQACKNKHPFQRVQISVQVDLEKLLIESQIYTLEEYKRKEEEINRAYKPLSEIRITWLDHNLYYHHNLDQYIHHASQAITIKRPGADFTDSFSLVNRGDRGLQVMFIPTYREKTLLCLAQIPYGYMEALQAPLSDTGKKRLADRVADEALQRGEMEVGLKTEIVHFNVMLVSEPDK